MKVEEWNEARASEVEGWHYEPPWDVYDLVSDPEDLAAMRDRAHNEHRREVHGDGVGRGLRPDITSRGLGESFLRAELVGDHEFVRMERAA